MSEQLASPRLTVPVGSSDHARGGPETAPLTLVEYGDYECPYCGAAYPIVKEIESVLGDELRSVFRNFPLGDSHPHAPQAAEAAEAAAAQARFWEMHDRLYENQQHLPRGRLTAPAWDRASSTRSAGPAATREGRRHGTPVRSSSAGR